MSQEKDNPSFLSDDDILEAKGILDAAAPRHPYPALAWVPGVGLFREQADGSWVLESETEAGM